MNPTSWVLIDACVARGLGDDHFSERPAEMRKALDALGTGPAGVMVTPALMKEWDRHASRFMKSWLARMTSRRRVVSRPDRRISDFRRAVDQQLADVDARHAILKDAHLTEAAIFQQAAVYSTDDRQRRHLRRVATAYALVADIQWFNPATDVVLLAQWIKSDATDARIGRIGVGGPDD